MTCTVEVTVPEGPVPAELVRAWEDVELLVSRQLGELRARVEAHCARLNASEVRVRIR